MLADEDNLLRAVESATDRNLDDTPIRQRMFAIDLLGSMAASPVLGQVARDAEAHLVALAQSSHFGLGASNASQRVRAAEAYDAMVALTHASPVLAARMAGNIKTADARPYGTAVFTELLDIGMSKVEARDWLTGISP